MTTNETTKAEALRTARALANTIALQICEHGADILRTRRDVQDLLAILQNIEAKAVR